MHFLNSYWLVLHLCFLTATALILCPSGEATFLLSDLLTAPNQTLTLALKDARGFALPGCTATLSAEELPNSNGVVTLSLAGQVSVPQSVAKKLLMGPCWPGHGEWVGLPSCSACVCASCGTPLASQQRRCQLVAAAVRHPSCWALLWHCWALL